MRKIKAMVVLLLCAVARAVPQQTQIDGLYRYTLENGLELFVAENFSAPLAYIEIAVRAGAVTQTPETAGLFHLYEHMMFKGNAKYADQAAVTAALNKMGVGEWNGSTGIDRVNYYFTVPSVLVRDGLEFWSYAIRTPKLDERELENEKNVVLSEINGNFSEPSRILFSGFSRRLFAESPWRLDSGGNPDAVRNATAADLRRIQQEYYVPNNAALFVGGAVHHEQIYEYVRQIYGGWKRGGAVLFEPPPSRAPFAADEKLVYANPNTSAQFVQVSYYLRGPDCEDCAADTHAADVWQFLADDPSGIFANTFVQEKSLAIPDAGYVSGGYLTRRASGQVYVHAAMMNSGALNPVEKSGRFMETLHKTLVPAMLQSRTEFSGEKLRFAEQKLRDSREYSMETAGGILSLLSFFWAAGGADYFFDYERNISAVTEADIKAFIRNYISGAHGAVIVTVNPAVYAQFKREFDAAGYAELTADNSFWWRDEQ